MIFETKKRHIPGYRCEMFSLEGRLFPILGTIVLICTSLVSAQQQSPSLPQGGGTTNGAWTAEFWENNDMSGDPVWTQLDIRVRHDWEDWRPIIGSRGEHVRDFPTDNFSVRWTSSFVSRFNERYTFLLVSDEGARLKVREQGAANWTTLIDAWDAHSRRTDSASIQLDPSKVYEAQVEYYDLSGDAVCELYWSSQSTPKEVVDYIGASIVHYTGSNQHANAFESGPFFGAPRDENGWPMTDFNILANTGEDYRGRCFIQFKGRADVEIRGAVFHVGGETYEKALPSGVGYDPATNTTRAEFDGEADVRLEMNNTQRSPDHEINTGVTDVYVMLPVKDGASEHHQPGEAANGEWRETMKPYVAFRVQRTGLNDNPDWDRRTPPTYSQIRGKDEEYGKSEFCYERLIMQANECGRDLHFNFGGSHNEEWMHKFARLVFYGSDGKEPYDGPTANPAYPPLNSNLRIYLEHGNEMGWSSIQPRGWTRHDLPKHFEDKDSVWQVLNYDGYLDRVSSAAVFRYHGYRTTRMSLAMRKVWGDANMGEKVRVMLYGQSHQSWQNKCYQFIDDYFNNGAGDFVTDPRPVNRHLWGGGLAMYYGCSNIWAEGDHVWLSDRSFEENDIGAGEAALAPQSAWTFTGTAGIVDYRFPRFPAHGGMGNETPVEAPATKVYGFSFTVGEKDIFVYAVGRIAQGTKTHQLAIYGGDGTQIEKRDPAVELLLNMEKEPQSSEGMREVRDGYVYTPLSYCAWITSVSYHPGLYRLSAGETYVIVSGEDAGDPILPAGTLTARNGITINGAVEADDGRVNGRSKLENMQLVSGAGTGYGHLNFLFTDAPKSPAAGMEIIPMDPSWGPNFPETSEKHRNPEEVLTGSKMAFIAGKGAISQSFTVTEEDEYTLVLTGGITDPYIPEDGSRGEYRWDRKYGNALNVFIGDSLVAEDLVMAAGRKPLGGYWTFGSEYLRLTPGTYEVRIEGTNESTRATVYIDGVHIGSMDDYFGGPNAENFREGGSETGATNSRLEKKMRHASAQAQNWGLVATTYEGGNSVGGDWNAGNVLFWEQGKFKHPYTKTADINAFNQWFSMGGHLGCHYYPPIDWSYYANSENYVQWQGAMHRANVWSLEASLDYHKYGFMAPVVLNCDSMHYTGSTGWRGYKAAYNDTWETDPELEAGGWKSWRILTPMAARYDLTAEVEGGTVILSADETNVAARGTGTVTGSVFLTKGAHTVKVKAVDGTCSVTSVSIGEPVVGVKNVRAGEKAFENGIFRKSVEIGIKSAGGK